MTGIERHGFGVYCARQDHEIDQRQRLDRIARRPDEKSIRRDGRSDDAPELFGFDWPRLTFRELDWRFPFRELDWRFR